MDKPSENCKLFAVGDIHGCHDKLAVLLSRLPFDPKTDIIVFLGDYINRGPQTCTVIETLLAFEKQCRQCIFLKGNHEHMLLQYVRTRDPEYLRLMRSMGIEQTLSSYSDAGVQSLSDLSFMPEDHRDFLKRLIPYYRKAPYLFIHAGVIPGEDPAKCSLDRLLTVRDMFLESTPEPDLTIVFGHTPFEMPLVTPGKIGIDTGAFLGNMLTAVMLPDMTFFHA